MDELSAFEKLAPFLTHPLVLIGFVVLIFFGLFHALLKAKLMPSFTKSTGGEVVKMFLRYGFIIALLIILLGCAVEGFKLYLGTEKKHDVSGVERPNNSANRGFLLTSK